MFPSGSPQRFQAADISLSTGQKHWRKPPGREADRMNWPEGKAVCGEQSIKVINSEVAQEVPEPLFRMAQRHHKEFCLMD